MRSSIDQKINLALTPSRCYGFHTADTVLQLTKDEINIQRERLEYLASQTNKRKILGYTGVACIPLKRFQKHGIGYHRCKEAYSYQMIGNGTKAALIARGALEMIPFLGAGILIPVDGTVTVCRFIHLKLSQRS